MSDTDDTDELLLIPPDQYSPHPESEVIHSLANGTYFKIVDSLIAQVNRLNNRVHSIEQVELSGSISNIMDHSNRYKSSDDILRDGYVNNSTYSTPQKPRMRYRSGSTSPHKQRGKFTATDNIHSPRKHGFSDFDYLHLTQTKKFNENSDIIEVNGRIINLVEIENMLEEIEIQKKKNDLRLKEQEEVMQKTQAWRMGDDFQSLPPSCQVDVYANKQVMQDNENSNFNDFTKMATKVTTLGVSRGGSVGMSSGLSSSTTSSSQLTARQVLSTNSKENESAGNYDYNKRGLLSLNELWGDSAQKQDGCGTLGSLAEKLEEEKLRRQHCEDLIQELQTRSLELQERLAVAVQVDKTKDYALSKFHDSWEKVTTRLKGLVDENNKLEMTIQDLHEKNENNMQECAEKLKHYEAEAAKALNLAHGSHDKLSTYIEQNTELQEKVVSLEKKIQDVEHSYDMEVKKSKQLNEIIVQKEIDLAESKHVLSDSRQEVAHSKQAIEMCQVEFANMKAQYNTLEQILTEKQTTIKDMESRIKTLEADKDHLKLLHVDAENELLAYKDKMDKTKCELRDFYQKQVEYHVQDKLKEFQAQLDRAECSFQDEINKRELSIAKTAATHIQQITDKHNLEVKLLEEKQKEEIKYYQMQVQQAQQHISTQQNKLKHFNERRTVLAQQLHKVMEVQWMEALKIINNTKSPYNGTPIDTTIDQLKSLKAKSQNNLDEVLSDPGEYSNDFEKNLQNDIGDTPVSSKNPGSKNLKDSKDNATELQKYVNLLLNKQTTATTATDPVKETTQNSQVKSEEIEDRNKPRYMKPPWK